jgi:hypothetical protein
VLQLIEGANCPDAARAGIPKGGEFAGVPIERSGDHWKMTTTRTQNVGTATNPTSVDVRLHFEKRTQEPVPGLKVTTEMVETMTFAGTSLTGTNVTTYDFEGVLQGEDLTGAHCVATYSLSGLTSPAIDDAAYAAMVAAS